MSDATLLATLKISNDLHQAMTELREFLYNNVYRSEQVHRQFEKAKKILSDLYDFFLDSEDELQKELETMGMGNSNHIQKSHERRVCDFIASMTDSHAMDLYQKIFFPSPLS